MSDISETQKAILRTCSYHRERYYFPLVQTNPGRVPDTLSKASDLPTSPVNTLASQNSNNEFPIFKLPLEIVSDILMRLDVKSFHSFRHANRRACAIASVIPQYRHVAQHAPEGIEALRRTGLSSRFKYRDLHRALITENCTLCGEFGGFLFLLTCTRCCYNCLREAPETGVVESHYVLRIYSTLLQHLDKGHALTICRVLTMASYRDLMIQDWKNPRTMQKDACGMLLSDVLKALRSVLPMEDDDVELLEQEWLHYRSAASVAYPTLDRRTMEVERGVSCKGCHQAFVGNGFEVLRHMLASPNIPSDSKARDRSFSNAGFQKHFESCQHTQKIGEESGYGSRETKDSEAVKQGGRLLAPVLMRAYISVYSEMLKRLTWT